MLRKALLIIAALFLITFHKNRINQTKAVINSNYLVVNSIEMHNIEELLTSVGFYIPSFDMDVNYISFNPYENDEGKVEVFIGDAFSTDILDKAKPNNNFLYNFYVSYDNTSKQVNITNQLPTSGNASVYKVNIGGQEYNLIRLE